MITTIYISGVLMAFCILVFIHLRGDLEISKETTWFDFAIFALKEVLGSWVTVLHYVLMFIGYYDED